MYLRMWAESLLGRYRQAAATGRRLLAAIPGEAEVTATVLFNEALGGERDAREAAARLRDMAVKESDDLRVAAMRFDAANLDWFRAKGAQRKRRAAAEMEAAAGDLSARSRDDPTPTVLLAVLYSKRGHAAVGLARIDELRQAGRLAPWPNLARNESVVASRAGQRDRARRAFLESERLDGRRPRARAFLASTMSVRAALAAIVVLGILFWHVWPVMVAGIVAGLWILEYDARVLFSPHARRDLRRRASLRLLSLFVVLSVTVAIVALGPSADDSGPGIPFRTPTPLAVAAAYVEGYRSIAARIVDNPADETDADLIARAFATHRYAMSEAPVEIDCSSSQAEQVVDVHLERCFAVTLLGADGTTASMRVGEVDLDGRWEVVYSSGP